MWSACHAHTRSIGSVWTNLSIRAPAIALCVEPTLLGPEVWRK